MASAQQQKCAGKLYFSSVQMVAYSFHSIMAASKEHELKILKLNVKIYICLCNSNNSRFTDIHRHNEKHNNNKN